LTSCRLVQTNKTQNHIKRMSVRSLT